MRCRHMYLRLNVEGEMEKIVYVQVYNESESEFIVYILGIKAHTHTNKRRVRYTTQRYQQEKSHGILMNGSSGV